MKWQPTWEEVGEKAEKGLRLANWVEEMVRGGGLLQSQGFSYRSGEGHDCGLFPSSFKFGG
jgi:hypothetical protein